MQPHGLEARSQEDQVDFESLEPLEPLMDSPLTSLGGAPSFESSLDIPTSLAGHAYHPLGELSAATATATARPLSASQGTKRVLEESAGRSQSLPAELAEAEGPGGGQKARERNKRAQRTFRQRQKAKAQQQEEELTVASDRIAELQEQVASLEQLLSADLGPVEAEIPTSLLPGETSVAARIRASSSALQLEKALLVVKENRLHSLFQEQQGNVRLAGQASASRSEYSVAGRGDIQQLLSRADPTLARSELLATRKRHLQSIKPCTAWEGCTPVPLEQLYSSILEGRLDLRIPLANGQAPERAILLSRLVAMPVRQHLQLQAQYHSCLASAAPFCSDPQSAHGQHFQAVMGEGMALLAVFCECLPEQFLACQSLNMLDATTHMPPETFAALKAAANTAALDAEQLSATRALYDSYAQQAARFSSERQHLLTMLQASAPGPHPLVPELSAPLQAASISEKMGCITTSYAMQQEAYLNLIRGFVLHILTPFQAGLLCAAAYPYLIEFPSIIWHVLNSAGSPSSGGPASAAVTIAQP